MQDFGDGVRVCERITRSDYSGLNGRNIGVGIVGCGIRQYWIK